LSDELNRVVRLYEKKVSLYDSQALAVRAQISALGQRLKESEKGRQKCIDSTPQQDVRTFRNIRAVNDARAAMARLKRETAEWTLQISDLRSDVDALEKQLDAIRSQRDFCHRKHQKFSLHLEQERREMRLRLRVIGETEIEEIYYANTPSEC
jgi:SMC interacting uncharacterized protein involved in chromosome segregation